MAPGAFKGAQSHFNIRVTSGGTVMGSKKSTNPENKNKVLLFLALGLPILSWGSAFPGIRYALSGYAPIQIASLRFVIASALLLGYALFKGFGLPDKRDIPMISFLAITGVLLYHVPLNTGARTVTAGTVSLLNSTAPVFTALLSSALIGERIQSRGWLGIFLSFTGAGLLAFSNGKGFSFSFGAAWILFAAFSESFYFIYQKGLLFKYGAVRLTTYVVWFGAVIMLPFSGNLMSALRDAPTGATLAVIYMGIFPTAIAYVLWAYDLSILPASRVASLLYLSPVISIFLGWVWLGEKPGFLTIGGGIIAILGVYCVQRSRITAKGTD
jgi:drug/metabolite transporter (DMT)-like permease